MQPMIVIMNFSYAIGGGLITLVFMYFGYKWLDLLTPFDTGESKGNRAVGQVVGSIFIGIGVAIGLVIGLGLN